MKIYIVDDDPDMCALMKAVLTRAGHQVWTQEVASWAIHDIAERRPDCVLVDLMMPELDGTGLISELRRRPELARTRFVAVSSNTADAWRRRMIDAGAAGYITKPIDPETFASEVQRIVSDAV